MINIREFGGWIITTPLPYTERRNGSLISVPSLRLPKGGLRWNNISEIGGVVYG